jgi:glycerol-3-phosphate acyltransferase PlsY
MYYLFSAIIGYLLGSVPTAYLLVKKINGTDITKEGSGNVGALNSLEVSKSKLIGISVLVIDLLKGTLSVMIPILIWQDMFIYPAVSLMFAVFSHCYNPWLQFKGGRGLATAAGGALIIFHYLLVLWIIQWVIFYLMRKNIHLANIAATIFSLIIVLGTSGIAVKYAFPAPESSSNLIMLTVGVLILILIKYIDPLKEIISAFKTNWKSKR